MTEPTRILHQKDVEAVINEKLIAIEAGDTVFGTVVTLDTGRASGEVPTNADLGEAAFLAVGNSAGDVAAGDDIRITSALQPGDIGTTPGTVAAGDDSRFTGVWGPWTSGVSESAANLAAIANAINTADKTVGKMVWDTTNHIPLFAGGVAAGDHWYTIAGVDTITPA